MTRVLLLEQLKAFTIAATRDLLLPLVPQEEELLLPPRYGPPRAAGPTLGPISLWGPPPWAGHVRPNSN